MSKGSTRETILYDTVAAIDVRLSKLYNAKN